MGGYVGGAAFDLTGDYTVSFGLGGLAGVLNLVILLAFSLSLRRRRAVAY